jgi:hypothetical protein
MMTDTKIITEEDLPVEYKDCLLEHNDGSIRIGRLNHYRNC